MQKSEKIKSNRLSFPVMQSLLIAGLLAAAHHLRNQPEEQVSEPSSPRRVEMPAPEKQEASAPVFDRALFSQRVREAGDRSDARVQEAELRFHARLRGLRHHQGFLQRLEETAVACGRKMNGDRVLLTVIRLAAEDRIRKTRKVDAWVAQQVDAELDPWVRAYAAELHLAAMELERALTVSREELAYDVAVAAHETHASMAVVSAEALKEDLLRTSFGRAALAGGLVLATAPLDIHALVSAQAVRKIPGMISRMIPRLFHKQVAAATAAAAAPLVDGPLPVGDVVGGVIAIGFTALTIAEWNGLKRELQENVTSTVRTELRGLRNQGIQEIRSSGNERIAQSRRVQQELLALAHAEASKQLVRR